MIAALLLAAAHLAALAPAAAVSDGYRPPPELRHRPSARCLRFERVGRDRPPADEREYLERLDAAIDFCSAPREQVVRDTAAELARTRPGTSPEALQAEAARMADEARAHFRRQQAEADSALWRSRASAAPVTGGSKGAALELADDLGQMYLSPERFSQERRQGFLWCDGSRIPNECHTAYMAASYSSATADLCWQRESVPYAGSHGGTMITGVAEAIARQCRASIRMCRDNWRYFFDLQPGTEPAVRTERVEAIIRQNVNGLCPQEAPADASDH